MARACVLAVNENQDVPIGARGEPPAPGGTTSNRAKSSHYRASEKDFSWGRMNQKVPSRDDPATDRRTRRCKAPCPRLKEWTSDGKGLEFTLATVVPLVPPNNVFGPFNLREPVQREPVQMARCITADLLLDRYEVEEEPGGVYSPAPYWCLLVTASRVDELVNPQDLLLCLESLRTSTTENLILCFHLIDWYRGKVKFHWWLELIITCFISYPRIRLLDE